MQVSEDPASGTVKLLDLSIGTWRFSVGRAAPSPLDLARLYDRAAWRWQSSIGVFGYSRAYAKLFNALAQDNWLSGLEEGSKVLDGGIGTAALSMALVHAVPGAREVHGIDIAPRMLARARQNLDGLNRPDVSAKLRYGDVDCLPYPAGEFGLVMSAHLLEHSRTPSQTVTELARVLRVGAPLLLVTTRGNRATSIHGLRWRYRALGSRQILSWMSRAGLCDVRRYPLGEGMSLPGLLSEAYIGRKSANTNALVQPSRA